jgi:hypothetical protein
VTVKDRLWILNGIGVNFGEMLKDPIIIHCGCANILHLDILDLHIPHFATEMQFISLQAYLY